MDKFTVERSAAEALMLEDWHINDIQMSFIRLQT